MNVVSKILRAYKRGGVRGLRHSLWQYRRRLKEERDYQNWIATHRLTDDTRRDLRKQISEFSSKPLISVILPVYNVDERWLRLCLDSLINQIYDVWELCAADDASTAAHVRTVLEEYAARDDRIKVVFRAENGHISAASNSALEIASGEYVALLDHDDELAEGALFWVAKEINEFPDTCLIYSDEDLIDKSGRRFGPKFKPDFSRDLLYSLNLLTHLSVFRTDIVRSLGGFRVGFEGSQDYDLSLRVIERIDDEQIRHIPRILYHWRVIEGSVAFSMDEKPYAHERARDAIREHFARTGVTGSVVETFHNIHRVHYSIPADKPFVSHIVTATQGFKPASVPINFEHATIKVERPNSGELNTAAASARGDVLLFVDGDLSLIEGSIDDLVAAAMQPGIGAAGGRILRRDMTVESAGIVLREDLSPAHAHHGFPREAAGNMYRNRQIGNFSAVSLSCLAIRRELFELVGGFDEGARPEAIIDADLCLRLRKRGFRIVMLPHVEFARRGDSPDECQLNPGELSNFRKRWPEYVERDPFCNPNLRRDGSFEISQSGDRNM